MPLSECNLNCDAGTSGKLESSSHHSIAITRWILFAGTQACKKVFDHFLWEEKRERESEQKAKQNKTWKTFKDTEENSMATVIRSVRCHRYQICLIWIARANDPLAQLGNRWGPHFSLLRVMIRPVVVQQFSTEVEHLTFSIYMKHKHKRFLGQFMRNIVGNIVFHVYFEILQNRKCFQILITQLSCFIDE